MEIFGPLSSNFWTLVLQNWIFFQFFYWGQISYDKMTTFHYWTCFVTAFWIFWTLGPNRSKNPKCSYKKSSITKSGHFFITYLAPIKKLKKFQFWKFLDLQGPIFGPRSGRPGLDLDLDQIIGQNQARIQFLYKSLFAEGYFVFLVLFSKFDFG